MSDRTVLTDQSGGPATLWSIPLDGIRTAQLHGSHAVVVIGG